MSSHKQRRAEYQRQQRAKRKALIEVHCSALKSYSRHKKNKASHVHVGFTAVRFKRDGSVVQLPPYMNHIFKACREFVDDAYRLPSVYKYGGSMVALNRRDVRLRLAKIMVVILARAELVDGRVGVPTIEGMDTISHAKLMDDYVLRWGEMIDTQTWYTSLKYLYNSGYLQQDTIVGSQQNLVFSAAAYKQFTARFFKELKVTLFDNISNMIAQARLKAAQKGYSFTWMPFQHLLQKAFEPALKSHQYQHTDSPAFTPH